MTLRLFTIFKMVVESGSISQASKQLYLTQPAVTRAISQLEEKLSLRLFDRIGKRIYVNEAGMEVYQKACQLIMLYEELQAKAKQLNQTPQLRIGSSITNANVVLPQLLQEFQTQYAGEVSVSVQNAKDIETQLIRNEIDLAFLEGAIQTEGLIQIPLFDYENVIFAKKAERWIHHPTFELTDLMEEAWLLREKGSAIRDTFDSVMLLHDEVIVPRWESVNSQALIEAVKQGLGISILPREIISSELRSGTITELNVSEKFICRNHIVYHKDKHVHAGMQAMLELCKHSLSCIAR